MERKQEHAPAQRFAWIDIAKAIAIFCVLMGHTVDSDTMSKTVLYSFHMPLFFMISGMLTRTRNSYTIKSMLEWGGKKIRTLYAPYFLWACIYAKFSFKNLLLILWGTRETLIKADCLTSLWFLPVLLIASVLMECMQAVIVKLKVNRIAGSVILTVVCFVIGFLIPHNNTYGDPFGTDIAFVAAGFMMAGKLMMELPERFREKLLFQGICLAGSLSVLVCYFVYFKPEDYVLMANAVYGNRVGFLVAAFAGSILVLSFSHLVEHGLGKLKIVSYIGRNTLGIFILHKPFVELFRKCVARIGFDYNHLLWTILIPVMTLCIVIPLLMLTDRYAPFLFGKAKPERRTA